MLAYCHGQIPNVAQATVRRYLDLLEHLFLVRQLRPWHENLRKRQVKRPKVYLRDSGVYHHLIGVGTMDALQTHPRIGASWEGFVIEKVTAEAAPDEALLLGDRRPFGPGCPSRRVQPGIRKRPMSRPTLAFWLWCCIGSRWQAVAGRSMKNAI